MHARLIIQKCQHICKTMIHLLYNNAQKKKDGNKPTENANLFFSNGFQGYFMHDTLVCVLVLNFVVGY